MIYVEYMNITYANMLGCVSRNGIKYTSDCCSLIVPGLKYYLCFGSIRALLVPNSYYLYNTCGPGRAAHMGGLALLESLERCTLEPGSPVVCCNLCFKDRGMDRAPRQEIYKKIKIT